MTKLEIQKQIANNTIRETLPTIVPTRSAQFKICIFKYEFAENIHEVFKAPHRERLTIIGYRFEQLFKDLLAQFGILLYCYTFGIL